ncbi:tyrosine-type recombinase/integrase [Candidatus Uabimicrobium sp. HlEnr_7]|uniref:tyrosine-type recombinase/integrase n=1 Tax=Candidatus Uabimicrobium helgolandensis TaxID=3095367 RepID=UPI003557341B
MTKPKPAPIPHRNGFRLQFSYNKKQYRRYYIRNQHAANALQSEINSLVTLVRHGLKQIPPNTSIDNYIFNTVVKPPQESNLSKSETLFSQLADEYLSTVTPKSKAESTIRTEKIHVRHLLRYLDSVGDIPISHLNVKFFQLYKNYRYRQGLRTDTVNKELCTFQLIVQHAVANTYLEENVVKQVKRDPSEVPDFRFRTNKEILLALKNNLYTPQEEKELRRYRYLMQEEVKQLVNLARDTDMYLILLVFAYTGMRRGELPKLQWTDVDLNKGLLWVYSKKQSRSRKEVKRRIEIPALLCRELEEHYEKNHENRWVFANKNGEPLTINQIHHSFKRIIKDSEFDGVGLHIFRHSLASNLAAESVDQRIIDSILGHQSAQVRERYRHLFPQQQSRAIALLDYT